MILILDVVVYFGPFRRIVSSVVVNLRPDKLTIHACWKFLFAQSSVDTLRLFIWWNFLHCWYLHFLHNCVRRAAANSFPFFVVYCPKFGRQFFTKCLTVSEAAFRSLHVTWTHSWRNTLATLFAVERARSVSTADWMRETWENKIRFVASKAKMMMILVTGYTL